MNTKKYKNIKKLIKKYNFSKFNLISNYGLFSGDTNLFKTLTIYDIIKRVKNLNGDIIEFGVWNGNTSLLIKKILDIYKIKKRIYLFDHFKGLQNFHRKDALNASKNKNMYRGNKKILKYFVKFFSLKKISIIDKDANELKKGYFKNKKFCLVLLDVDLYKPTLKILQSVETNICKNGLIVFDEGNSKWWPSERKAISEFLKKSKIKYKKELVPFARQPDVILKKI